MKKILIPIILSVLVAVSSCGPKRYLTTSRAPGVGLDTINYGAYNNDPSADRAGYDKHYKPHSHNTGSLRNKCYFAYSEYNCFNRSDDKPCKRCDEEFQQSCYLYCLKWWSITDVDSNCNGCFGSSTG